MSDLSHPEAELPRRLRRGQSPRLYVIARQSPVPWLRVRRIGNADRGALMAHLGRLVPEHRRHRGRIEMTIAERCTMADHAQVTAFVAIAGNDIIAAACGAAVKAGTSAIVLTSRPSAPKPAATA